jgi:hypothetical protein
MQAFEFLGLRFFSLSLRLELIRFGCPARSRLFQSLFEVTHQQFSIDQAIGPFGDSFDSTMD